MLNIPFFSKIFVLKTFIMNKVKMKIFKVWQIIFIDRAFKNKFYIIIN